MSETCLGTIDRINMKRRLHAILFVFILTLLTSFSYSLPRRFESFVEKVEENCRRWNKKEWAVAKDEYSRLMAECRESYDHMSEYDQQRINAAIGKYRGIVVKMGVEDAGDAVKKYCRKIPDQLKGFVSAFE